MIRFFLQIIAIIATGALNLVDPVQAHTSEASKSTPGTQRMAERLEKIIRSIDPLQNAWSNDERAVKYGELLAKATKLTDIVELQALTAQELLLAGRTGEAIQALGKLEQLIRQNPTLIDPRNLSALRIYQATCYLRQAVDDNCRGANHNADSCLLPISGAGVHRNQRGARAAIEVLTTHLNTVPKGQRHLRAEWLLNLGYMYLGQYPDQVPRQWLIDPKLFAPEYDIKRFPDLAPTLGLDVDDLAGGSIMEDFDGDGLLDVMASSWALRGQLRLFHNDGNGRFTEWTERAGLTGEVGGLNIVQTDYNNDGHPDVLVLRGAWAGPLGRFPNSLLRNKGDGTFTDVTEEAGLLSFHPTQTAVWFDYNGDGWLDLFIGNESTGDEVHPCELYRNNGDGTFAECAAQMGIAVKAFVKGVASGDFNNDGWPDLYLSILGKPNILYRNDGPAGADKSPKAPWKFTDVSVTAGVTEPIASFPTWFWDYDNDGWMDIFVSGFTFGVDLVVADYLGMQNPSERPRLYHNNHDGTFTDVTRPAGLYRNLLAMGANYGDLDNDGFLDFYVGTGDPELTTIIPNRMFRNAGGQRFQGVTTSGGFGHLQKGHGISFGDLDNDGDQDIHAVMGGAYTGDHFYNALFENPGHGNHWITLKLEGVKSNRAALGARIKVIVENPNGERAIYKTVSTGGSFGASPLRQEIGLGDAKSIKAVEVFWPVTGKTQVLKNLTLDQFYRVREGDTGAVPWKLKTFKLASGPAKTAAH